MNKSKKERQRKADMCEQLFEHLGSFPSHPVPSTSAEEWYQWHGYCADGCIGGRIHFELLWKAWKRKWVCKAEFEWDDLNDYHASGTWSSSCTNGVCGPKELERWRSRSRAWYATLASLTTFGCPALSLGANPIHRVLMPVGKSAWQIYNVDDYGEDTSVNEVTYVDRIKCRQNLAQVILEQPVKRKKRRKENNETYRTRSSLKESLSSKTSCKVKAGNCSESTINWGGWLKRGIWSLIAYTLRSFGCRTVDSFCISCSTCFNFFLPWVVV